MSERLKQKSTRSKWLKAMRKFHKWPGIILAVFVILFSLSGIILNHRNWFSAVDVSRNLLPPDFRLNNWNLASIRGAVHVSPDDMVIYGNIGAWLTTEKMDRFIDLNEGFPKGIDNRKIDAMLLTNNGELLAGTLFGLYSYNGETWQPVNIPVSHKRITDLTEHDEKIHILTRSQLLLTSNLKDFEIVNLPPSLHDDNKVSLFRTLWTLHSGELFGEVGKIAVDILGLGLIFLSVTGILHWIFPGWIKRRKKKEQGVEKVKKAFVQNLKLHNKVGYILAFFLVITAITGMFLRPPLLITIAPKKVNKIPYTILDNPNPWHDKLRRIIWDEAHERYLVSTSDGFFFFDNTFSAPAERVPMQPPVSVMGCTVLEPHPSVLGNYIVGSFTGLFKWDVQTGAIINVMTNSFYSPSGRMGSPISENLISGYIRTSTDRYVVDYSRGLEHLSGSNTPPQMPKPIIEATPMSLWNVALDVHTGRIFQHLLGSLYILYIPLAGITLLIVLISGFVIWWLAHKKKKKEQVS
ncbi:PepSY-associated TM helix domain-containing protein [Alkaliflexus imshenetskii]|uniref:PepSY-associated TM helix domain-containing protein n=1 Tax=Alkaliflexus imshenetskii TaxID=286730 RepID=UPI000693B92E|nr:PepSY-associated TM helix domain-containing protein [Alkaliflexus imshenetskii]